MLARVARYFPTGRSQGGQFESQVNSPSQERQRATQMSYDKNNVGEAVEQPSRD